MWHLVSVILILIEDTGGRQGGVLATSNFSRAILPSPHEIIEHISKLDESMSTAIELSSDWDRDLDVELGTCNSQYAKCGDICIHWSNQCNCGGDTFSIFADPLHCCVDTLSDPTQCERDDDDNGYCPHGTSQHKTSPCPGSGTCFNDYRHPPLGLLSQYKCGSGECVDVISMCQGYSLCSDGSDTEECIEGLKCRYSTGGNTVERLPTGHHYCHYHILDNDGEYDTIGRTDEVPSVADQQTNIDYNSLVPCRDDKNQTVKYQNT